eukprot:TRINITY_DN16908_c0_g1_i1.p1 TRINITY_DN16908_c0_g1~~TRINITY_DN16908_c0_g1_i1.p1  ORF type:complete len:874 (+),score=267.36 TRINITY_DN16908_c0_g1_i1:116-2737(+)
MMRSAALALTWASVAFAQTAVGGNTRMNATECTPNTCLSPAFCYDHTSGAAKMCVLDVGSTCELQGTPCMPGSECIKGMCTAPLCTDKSCSPGEKCVPDYTNQTVLCVKDTDQKCNPPCPVAGTCMMDSKGGYSCPKDPPVVTDPCDCTAGLVCWEDTCVEPVSLGAECSLDSAPCKTGLECVNSTSAAMVATCQTVDACAQVDCPTGEVCRMGACVNPCATMRCPGGCVVEAGTAVCKEPTEAPKPNCGLRCPVGQSCVFANGQQMCKTPMPPSTDVPVMLCDLTCPSGQKCMLSASNQPKCTPLNPGLPEDCSPNKPCPQGLRCHPNAMKCMPDVMPNNTKTCSDLTCTGMCVGGVAGMEPRCVDLPTSKYDCSFDGVWSDVHRTWCCDNKEVGCSTPQVNCTGMSPDMQVHPSEVRYCCNAHQGAWCDKDQFQCGGNVNMFGRDQQQWCCDKKKVACGAPARFECSNMTSATSEKKMFCCKEHLVGCNDLTEDVFSCEWSKDTSAPWTSAQRDWCCDKKQTRCLSENEQKEERALLSCKTSYTTLTPDQQDACCDKFSIRCKASTRFNCSTDVAQWGNDQRDWCCTEEDIACAYSCSATIHGALEDDAERNFCCDAKGLGCGKSWWDKQQKEDEEASTQETKPRNAFRFTFKGKFTAELQENPKKILRRMRLTLLKGSSILRADPASLIVKLIGLLNPEGKITTGDSASNWQWPVPLVWNTDLHAEESALVNTTFFVGTSTSRDAKVLEEAASDSMYVEYDVVGENGEKTGDELATAAKNGELASNTGGYTLPIEGGEVASVASTPKGNDDDDDSTAWWVFVLATLGGVACVGMVGFMVIKSKPSSSSGPVRFEDCAMMEDVENKDPALC